MARIFISYRRDDSAGHVGWMRSLLIQKFGADEIFRDLDTIPPGVDFVEAIEQAVASCEVLLAVIGPRWLTATNSRGQLRLENPEDLVRVEIAAALDRNIRVIPVLVQDAPMPRSDELPQPLARLARRNAIELRDSSWEYDVGRLIAALESVFQPKSRAEREVEQPVQQTQSSSQIDVLLSQLREAETQENWDAAIAIGEQIWKLDPSQQDSRMKIADMYGNRGNTRRAQGDLTGAIRDYDQSITLDPNFAPVHYNRGVARYEQGDLIGAIRDYEQAIQLDPNLALAYNNRGNVRKVQGDLTGAIRDYDQAITLDPNYVAPYFNRGNARRAQGDLTGAIRDYDQAVKLDPTLVLTYNNRGLVREAQGDIQGGISDYNQAIQIDPNFALAYYNRGLAHLTQKNREAARRDFERAAQLGDEDAKKELDKL
jgi:tetratricopeptide (TPR) repeat protein